MLLYNKCSSFVNLKGFPLKHIKVESSTQTNRFKLLQFQLVIFGVTCVLDDIIILFISFMVYITNISWSAT